MGGVAKRVTVVRHCVNMTKSDRKSPGSLGDSQGLLAPRPAGSKAPMDSELRTQNSDDNVKVTPLVGLEMYSRIEPYTGGDCIRRAQGKSSMVRLRLRVTINITLSHIFGLGQWYLRAMACNRLLKSARQREQLGRGSCLYFWQSSLCASAKPLLCIMIPVTSS